MRQTISAMISKWVTIVAVALFFSTTAVATDRSIEGVPLPTDAAPLPTGESTSPFAGVWFGRWGGWRKTILVVEAINNDGTARVVYSIAENPRSRQKPAWFRLDATIAGEKMTVLGDRFSLTYELSSTGRLFATFGDNLGFGVMLRQDPDVITRQAAEIRWGASTSEFLQTELVDNGQAVKLEAVIFKPYGDGPFPLAVVNHGSTGRGNNQTAFTDTWTNPWFAEFLNSRGYIVAFPQRRGRGKSGGLYDEGFREDRSKGYTCEAQRSLAGAGRAMEDLAASIDALRKRPDVKAGPVLLAGNSRGGILSVAYAGEHSEIVKGVINFVGGWIGEGCQTADKINKPLFLKGSDFGKSMLWLYGKQDYFYSIEHSRSNFTAFEKNGGTGTFVELAVLGKNNGHWVMSIPPLWEDHASGYLDGLEK